MGQRGRGREGGREREREHEVEKIVSLLLKCFINSFSFVWTRDFCRKQSGAEKEERERERYRKY